MNDNLKSLSEKLEIQYGKEIKDKIFDGYNSKKFVTLRVNNLKTNLEDVCSFFDSVNIKYDTVDWYKYALIIKNANEKDLQELEIYKEGKIYLQSLSSMLPPIILSPKENIDILDMCAAPGGKTSELAAICNNKINITACEMNAVRCERLKYNIEKLGVRNISVMKKDSRFLDDFFSFDSILLDSPCSGSGTINLNFENTYNNFSFNLVNKCIKLQIALLRKAVKLLKKGQCMVYSTCSILQEENEDIINQIIKEFSLEIEPISLVDLPLLPCKINGAICVMPTDLYEGFFVVKLRKK